MNILHVILRPPNFPGGAEIFCKKLIQGLQREHVHSVILTGVPHNSRIHIEKIMRIKCIIQKFLKAFGGVSFEIYHTPNALKKVARSFDLIHIHSFITLTALQTALFAKLYNIPLVTTIHGNLKSPIIKNQSIRQTLKMIFIRMYYNVLGKVILDLSDAVISVSKNDLLSIREKLLCTRQKNNFWIPNCVNVVPSSNAHTRKYVTFIGRLSKRKGFDDFLKIVEEISQKIDGLQIIVVGTGPLEPLLLKKAKSLNITHIQSIPHEEIHEIYRQTLVFVMTSWVEGMPTVILEAMAHGAAVVSTDVGGIPELIQDGKNGYLVSPGEIHRPAEKIIQLLQNEPLREGYVKISKEIINTSFTCKKIAQKHIVVYKKLM